MNKTSIKKLLILTTKQNQVYRSNNQCFNINTYSKVVSYIAYSNRTIFLFKKQHINFKILYTLNF